MITRRHLQTTALILVTGLFAHFAQAADTLVRVAAGITPYACTNQGTQYLLAYDLHPRRLGWGAFGGGPKGQETGQQTARREFREETNCVYSQIEVDNLKLTGPSRSNSYYTYVTKVPFRSIEQIETIRKCNDVERLGWVWVPHDALIQALKSHSERPIIRWPNNRGQQYPLWKGAAKSIRNALKKGILSEIDPCASKP